MPKRGISYISESVAPKMSCSDEGDAVGCKLEHPLPWYSVRYTRVTLYRAKCDAAVVYGLPQSELWDASLCCCP